jgi:hypothetical protein
VQDCFLNISPFVADAQLIAETPPIATNRARQGDIMVAWFAISRIISAAMGASTQLVAQYFRVNTQTKNCDVRQYTDILR